MASPDAAQQRGGRETRLLLVTIAVSIGVLLLLARFRFPEQASEPLATPATAPLERLAARAAYDELASTMADLERRLAGAVTVLRVEPERESGAFVVAPRLTADRAVTLISLGEALPGDSGGTSRIISMDLTRELAVVAVPPDPNAIVTPRSGPPRPGPRYVVAVEGNADGLTIRPLYVGRTSTFHDQRSSMPLLSFSGVQNPVPRGAAIFSLDGIFIGLVVKEGPITTVVPADFLQATAESAVPVADRAPDPIDTLDALGIVRHTLSENGLEIVEVTKDSPAARAGLRRGDVIVTFDGRAPRDLEDITRAFRKAAPGTAWVLIVRRGQAPSVLALEKR
jgi:hypothetical protein